MSESNKSITTDTNKPTRRQTAMVDAIWTLARVVILLPTLTPFWLLYTICAGAGNCAEFLEDLFNILSQRFRLAFAGPDTYDKVKREFEEIKELRTRVEWLVCAGNELARHAPEQARDEWNHAKLIKP